MLWWNGFRSWATIIAVIVDCGYLRLNIRQPNTKTNGRCLFNVKYCPSIRLEHFYSSQYTHHFLICKMIAAIVQTEIVKVNIFTINSLSGKLDFGCLGVFTVFTESAKAAVAAFFVPLICYLSTYTYTYTIFRSTSFLRPQDEPKNIWHLNRFSNILQTLPNHSMFATYVKHNTLFHSLSPHHHIFRYEWLLTILTICLQHAFPDTR